jgi:hypothetical protein
VDVARSRDLLGPNIESIVFKGDCDMKKLFTAVLALAALAVAGMAPVFAHTMPRDNGVSSSYGQAPSSPGSADRFGAGTQS